MITALNDASSVEAIRADGMAGRLVRMAGAAALACMVLACQPTVRVETPQEPITINLNVKIDADVRVKLEEQAEDDIEAQDDIF